MEKQKSNWIEKKDGWHRREASRTADHVPNPNWITSAISPEHWTRPDGTIDWNAWYEYRKTVGLSK